MVKTAHIPVLLEEVLELSAVRARRVGGVFRVLDCTLGGGGHSEALLMSGEEVSVLGIDRDEGALARASQRLSKFGSRVSFRAASFGPTALSLSKALVQEDSDKFDLVLADLGFSSDQLEDRSRGFSFQVDGPLDMRMNMRGELSAEQLLNELSPSELRRMFIRGGMRTHTTALSNAIVAARPLRTTAQFRAVCEQVLKGVSAPAAVPFQAVRIAVNKEFEELEQLLDAIPNLLSKNGRALIISFHSLEDRLVTQAFRRWSRGFRPRRDLPEQPALGRLLTSQAVVASESELALNSRARSARLRAFVRGAVAAGNTTHGGVN